MDPRLFNFFLTGCREAVQGFEYSTEAQHFQSI